MLHHPSNTSCVLLFLLAVASSVVAKSPGEMSIAELGEAYTENPRDVAVALELGVRYYRELREAGKDGAYGSRQNRKRLDLLHKNAMKYLKRAQFMTRFAALPNAYIGSLTVVRGRDVSYSGRGLLVKWRAPKNFGEGASAIDQAVKQAPDDVAVRLVRVEDAEHVPMMLTAPGGDGAQKRVPRRSRFTLAVADLKFVIEKHAEGEGVARRFDAAGLHLRAGRLFRQLGNYDSAREYLERTIQLGGESQAAEEAQAILAKLPHGAVDDALKEKQ